jgi:hypothetical protein
LLNRRQREQTPLYKPQARQACWIEKLREQTPWNNQREQVPLNKHQSHKAKQTSVQWKHRLGDPKTSSETPFNSNSWDEEQNDNNRPQQQPVLT